MICLQKNENRRTCISAKIILLEVVQYYISYFVEIWRSYTLEHGAEWGLMVLSSVGFEVLVSVLIANAS